MEIRVKRCFGIATLLASVWVAGELPVDGSAGAAGIGGSVEHAAIGRTVGSRADVASGDGTSCTVTVFSNPDVSSSIPTGLVCQSGSVTATLMVPIGALPLGTMVTLSLGGDPSQFAARRSGQSYVTLAGVSWVAPDGRSPVATAPVKVALSDTAIKVGDAILALSPAGPTAVGVATGNNTLEVSLTSEESFAIASMPNVRILSTYAKLSGEAVEVTLSCGPAAPCLVWASVAVTSSGTTANGKTLQTTIAQGSSSLRAGETATVDLPITDSGQEILAHRAGGTPFRARLVVGVMGGIQSSLAVYLR